MERMALTLRPRYMRDTPSRIGLGAAGSGPEMTASAGCLEARERRRALTTDKSPEGVHGRTRRLLSESALLDLCLDTARQSAGGESTDNRSDVHVQRVDERPRADTGDGPAHEWCQRRWDGQPCGCNSLLAGDCRAAHQAPHRVVLHEIKRYKHVRLTRRQEVLIYSPVPNVSRTV
jgi:hypothetical protein